MEKALSKHKILSVADAKWAEDESHYGHHRYRVRTYVYSGKSAVYSQADDYVTAKKYPGLDDVERLDVLGPEEPAIRARLTSARSAPARGRRAP